MHETCYDSYHTTFGTYAAMLDYHQEQAVKSQWTRVPVRDLEVEPLSPRLRRSMGSRAHLPQKPAKRPWKTRQQTLALPFG